MENRNENLEEKFEQNNSVDTFEGSVNSGASDELGGADYKDTFNDNQSLEDEPRSYQNEANHFDNDSFNKTNYEKQVDEHFNENRSDLKHTKNTTLSRIKFYVSMIFGAIVIILIIFSLIKNIASGKEEKQEVKQVEATNVQSINKELFSTVKNEIIPTVQNIVNPPKDENPFEKKQEEEIFTAEPKKQVITPQIIKGSSSGVIGGNSSKKGSNGSTGNSSYDEQIKELEAQREAILNPKNQAASNGDFNSDTFTPTVARINEFNPDLLLPKGSYIGCSIDTRFVSNVSGSTSCTVSQNIYSSNGNVLLIEKGSKLFGTYKGDQANDGASRYFIVWQEIRTPNHLRIPINSGSSDELGGAGLEGEIDHKWMTRFGASILLSMVDDTFNVLAYKLTNGNNNNANNRIDYTENTRDNASNMASIALEKFINIKPTIYKQHGDLVGVYVNRDVDFSQVYKLKFAKK